MSSTSSLPSLSLQESRTIPRPRGLRIYSVSTTAKAALYQPGLTGIQIASANNDCAMGSAAVVPAGNAVRASQPLSANPPIIDHFGLVGSARSATTPFLSPSLFGPILSPLLLTHALSSTYNAYFSFAFSFERVAPGTLGTKTAFPSRPNPMRLLSTAAERASPDPLPICDSRVFQELEWNIWQDR
ncbi:hypothetical protein EDB86DRAFT_3085072 [Lactarius hatsudake]|nr:hypothetical protein EDB86DRAFT_3085072 [Lactarius hatsudake]